VAAVKFALKNILTRRLLPGGDAPGQRGKAPAFTAYFCRDDKSLWISDAEGNLISISDLLAGAGAPRTFPFVPTIGPQGPQGIPGATGPAGPIGATGPQGEKGEPGSLLVPTNTEIAAAMLALRQKQINVQAALFNEMLRLPTLPTNQRIHVKNALERIKKEIL